MRYLRGFGSKGIGLLRKAMKTIRPQKGFLSVDQGNQIRDIQDAVLIEIRKWEAFRRNRFNAQKMAAKFLFRNSADYHRTRGIGNNRRIHAIVGADESASLTFPLIYPPVGLVFQGIIGTVFAIVKRLSLI